MFKTAIQMVKCFFTPEAEKKAILFKKIYAYYYTTYMAKLNNPDSGVVIPDFLLEGRIAGYAVSKAQRDLEKVIRECRLNKCYINALNS